MTTALKLALGSLVVGITVLGLKYVAYLMTGSIALYPDLWARQARAGETEGRKERPVAVGVRIAQVDGDLPIGRFSKAFFLPLLRAFIARRKTFTEVSQFR
jgi:hypothetical protein